MAGPTKAEVLAELARRGIKLPEAQNPFAAQDKEQVTAAQADAKRALQIAQEAEKFVDLNKETGTGGLRALALPGFLGGGSVADVAGWFDPNIGAMNAISSRVAPTFRQPGSGSSSDKDVAMYQQSFPNLKYPGQANKKIAGELNNESSKKAALSSFYRTWFEKRGSLKGADEAFGEFWKDRQNKVLKSASSAARPSVSPPQEEIVIDVFGRPVK